MGTQEIKWHRYPAEKPEASEYRIVTIYGKQSKRTFLNVLHYSAKHDKWGVFDFDENDARMTFGGAYDIGGDYPVIAFADHVEPAEYIPEKPVISMADVGKVLKNIRKETGFKAEAFFYRYLADTVQGQKQKKKVSISPFVYRLEKGIISPGADILAVYSELSGRSIDSIVKGVE